MKNIYINLSVILTLILLIGNIYIFVTGIRLGEEISSFEKGISTLHQENIDLETKVYQMDSLQYAASMAASYNFTNKSQPLVLENIKYALNR